MFGRTTALLCALLGASFLGGCPRELQPPPPGEAAPCAVDEDCNAGRSCGLLAICVGGFCEAEPSLVIACPGEGVPVRPEEATPLDADRDR
jgi:hypothetical protein